MQFQQPFDARAVEPASFAPPPPMADYHVRIVGSEPKPTKDQTGGYLQLILEILDPGPYQGRKINYNLNLFNKDAQTCEIAYRQLSAICHVCNVYNVQDTRQLDNIPFIATIGPQKDNPQYANVFGVKDLNGVIPGKAGAPAAPAAFPVTPAPPPAAPAPPTWQPGPPTAPPAATAPPAWAPPGQATPTPPAPPAWQPGPPPAPAAAAPAAPAWAPAGTAAPTAPPWAR